MTRVTPTGLDRIRATAEQYGWTEQKGLRSMGFTRGVRYVNVDHTVRGAVTGADRNWGSSKYANAGSGKAERVIRWLMESADVAEVRDAVPTTSARGRMYERARLQGDWTVSGGSLEVDYRRGTGSPADIHHIHARFEADGSLKWARRDFGPTGRPREVHGNMTVETVLSWFLEGSQAAPKPVIRSAEPNTPDRQLLARLEELKDDLADLTAKARRSKAGTAGEIPVDDLAKLSGDLEDLTRKTRTVSREALYLWAERRYGPDMVAVVKEIHRRDDTAGVSVR